MKPIHKIVYKDPQRTIFQYAQVKDGKLIVLTPYQIVVFKAEDVLGEGNGDGHFYIERNEWGRAKMDKAVRIEQDAGLLVGYDRKNGVLGRVKMILESELPGRFPEWEFCMPESTTPLHGVDNHGLDAELFYQTVQVMAVPFNNVRIFFYGPDTNVILRAADSSGRALDITALIVPTCHNPEKYFFGWPAVTEEIDPLS